VSTLAERVKQGAEEAAAEEAAELARIAAIEKGEQPVKAEQPKDEGKPADQHATPENPPQPVKAEQADELAQLKADLERERLAREAAEQKYRTADGMLRKKEDTRDEEIRALREQIKALADRQAQEPQKPKEPGKLRLLNADERQAVGENGQEPLEYRMAKGDIDATADQLRQEFEAKLKAQAEQARKQFNDELTQRAATEQAKATNARLLDAVEKLAPGFLADDSSVTSKWQDFLRLPDPDSVIGATYGDRGAALFNAGNAKGVAQLYAEYLALNPSGSRAAKLESQVKPDTSHAQGKPKPANAPVEHTMEEYSEFYRDLTRGKVKPNADGTPRTRQQIAALQAELDDWYYKQQLGGR
jgi:hypothetical protein